jgi:hypothetical protein
MARLSRAGGRHARPAGSAKENQVHVRRSDDADAFIRDPESRPVHSSDILADTLGREFVKAATTGEDMADEDLEQEVPEEVGGPFLESEASREYDPHPDESNPPGATKEALPTAMGRGPPTQVDLEEAEENPEGEEESVEGEPEPEPPKAR